MLLPCLMPAATWGICSLQLLIARCISSKDSSRQVAHAVGVTASMHGVQVDVTAPTAPGQAPPGKGDVPAVIPGVDQNNDSKNVLNLVTQQQTNQGWGKKDPWATVAHGVVGNKPHTQVRSDTGMAPVFFSVLPCFLPCTCKAVRSAMPSPSQP